MSKNNYLSDRRVVITGIGTINPIGNTVEEFWDALLQLKNGVNRIRCFDPGDYSVKIAAEVDLPDISGYFEKKKKMMRRLDRNIILAYIASYQAIADAGLDSSAAPHRFGCLIGTGEAGLITHMHQIPKIMNKGLNAASPFYIINAIPNTATAYVSQEWNLNGPSYTLSSACATSNHAISTSALMIKAGMADAFVTGGTEAVVSPVAIGAFGNIMALSTRNDSPETASRPFERDRDGFVLGEGAGILCLEELEHAKKRGARIYAELTGFGLSSDSHDLVAPHPEGRGAAEAISAALDIAQLNPEDIDLINCHGTSTPIGDYIESLAIRKALGDCGGTVPVHSTKSMTGHLIGATGSVELIADIPAIQKGIIHATANQFEHDPKIELNVVKETMEGVKVRHILSNGFGFGGHNSSLIFSKFDA